MFGFGIPEALKTPCRCGFDGTRAVECTEGGLRDHRFFPAFRELPDEHDVDERFYDFTSGVGMPRFHWCLVGDVVEVESFMRVRARLQTRFGEEVMAHFYLDNRADPVFFDWSAIKPGESCMCVLYAIIHNFMDMTRGLRIECPTSVMVFPVAQDVLCEEVDKLNRLADATSAVGSCSVCGKSDTTMSACSQCKVMRYCSKECQRQHWSKGGHKQLCKHMPMLSKFAHFSRNMGDFNDFQTFQLEPFSKPDRAERSRNHMQEHIAHMSPGASLWNLRRLLTAVCDRVLLEDAAAKVPFSSVRKELRDGTSLPSGDKTAVREMWLFKQLMDFCDEQAKNPAYRVHVVDAPKQDGIGAFGAEIADASIGLALPKWAVEIGVARDLAFFFEDHSFEMYVDECYQKSAVDKRNWEVTRDGPEEYVDLAILKHRSASSCAVLADSMQFVGDMAKHLAEKDRGRAAVRVLRATGNVSLAKTIKRLATEKTPDNVYTLWIRESVAVCGSFKAPFKKDGDLVTQLLAAQGSDPLEEMLGVRMGGMSFNRGNGFSSSEDEAESHATGSGTQRKSASIANAPRRGKGKKGGERSRGEKGGEQASVSCSVCGRAEGAVEFAKNQRKKSQDARKCKGCTGC